MAMAIHRDLANARSVANSLLESWRDKDMCSHKHRLLQLRNAFARAEQASKELPAPDAAARVARELLAEEALLMDLPVLLDEPTRSRKPCKRAPKKQPVVFGRSVVHRFRWDVIDATARVASALAALPLREEEVTRLKHVQHALAATAEHLGPDPRFAVSISVIVTPCAATP